MFTSPARPVPTAPNSEQQLSMAPATARAPGARPSRSTASARRGNVAVDGTRVGKRSSARPAAARMSALQSLVSRSTSIVREAHERSSTSTPHSSARAYPRSERKRWVRARTSGCSACHHSAWSRNEATAGSDPVRRRSSPGSIPIASTRHGPACGRRSAGARAGPSGRPSASTGAMAVPRQENTSVSMASSGQVPARPAMRPSMAASTASSG